MYQRVGALAEKLITEDYGVAALAEKAVGTGRELVKFQRHAFQSRVRLEELVMLQKVCQHMFLFPHSVVVFLPQLFHFGLLGFCELRSVINACYPLIRKLLHALIAFLLHKPRIAVSAKLRLAVVDLKPPLSVSALEPAGSLADAFHVGAEGLHLLRVFQMLEVCRARLLPCKAVLSLRSAVVVFVEQITELILAYLPSCKLISQRLKVFIRRHFACAAFRLSFLCSFLSGLLCGSFLRRGSLCRGSFLSGLLCRSCLRRGSLSGLLRRGSFPRGLRRCFRLEGNINRAVSGFLECLLIVAPRPRKKRSFLRLFVPYLGEQVVNKLQYPLAEARALRNDSFDARLVRKKIFLNKLRDYLRIYLFIASERMAVLFVKRGLFLSHFRKVAALLLYLTEDNAP